MHSHLVLHRVIYGPEDPANLNLSPIQGLGGLVLEPERELPELEMLAAAKGEQAAKTAAEAMVRQRPALNRRVINSGS